MRTFVSTRALALAAILTVSAGCSDAPSCVAGRVETCPCSGGASGIQTCQADGTFGSCVCDGVDGGTTDSGVADAGIDAAVTEDAGASDSGASLDATTDDASASDAAVADGGVVHGHAVLIGHLGIVPADGQDDVIANAIFSSERAGELDVVSYTERADPSWMGHIEGLIDDQATARGRVVRRSTLATASGLGTALASADVLLVLHQLADESTMRTVAGFWHDALVGFLDAGGVVVVLSAATGGSGGYEYLLLDGDRLFTLPAREVNTASTSVEIVAPTDVVAAGVISPYPAGSQSILCFPSSSGGTLVARTQTALCPVVRHRVY